MEKTEDKPIKELGLENGLNIGLIKNNITTLDLSHRNITNFSEDLILPPNLTELNLSHNKLENVTEAIMKHKYIKILDVSFNEIKYFDDTPSFCNNIEDLNISNNVFHGPPAWIWFANPKKLTKLDISSNHNLTYSFQFGYFEELIQFKTSITDIKIHNCKLHKFLLFMKTFPKAKSIQLGEIYLSYFAANLITDFPCQGIIECCDIEKLNLSNTQLFSIKPSIDIYKNLIEINLSHNELSGLPNEFCNLECLEVCILSCNRILYLPENFLKLKKLNTLCIDSNELCTIPDDVCCLPYLKKLDLYDNYLCEVVVDLSRIQETDLAQNYMNEPANEVYISKKERLRLAAFGRLDGRKYENIKSESIYTPKTSDDESFDLPNDRSYDKDIPVNENCSTSSVEDWDSDEYWVPHYIKKITPSVSPWLYFVKQKMEEGNFCPMDIHTVPVSLRVQYDKVIYPTIQYESDGQFDDYSSDDS